MATFEFSSVLPEEFREDLELLLFFNPLQHGVRGALAQCIDEHGEPELHTENGRLRVTLSRMPQVQTIFALAVQDDACELAGLVIYGRRGDSGEYIEIIHVAVAEAFSSATRGSGAIAALRLVSVVRNAASRLNGVRYLGLPYANGRLRRLCMLRPHGGWTYHRSEPTPSSIGSPFLHTDPAAVSPAVRVH